MLKENGRKMKKFLLEYIHHALLAIFLALADVIVALNLESAMQMVEKEGKGVIVYMNQEGRGIGLLNKLKAYKLQEQGKRYSRGK